MAATTDLEVTSDAAGAVGYGAYYNGDWFNGRWSPCQLQHSIAYKELFPTPPSPSTLENGLVVGCDRVAM
ncbi:hypothetical protein QZH41_017383, partial [Actinostola sp. cb2023]